MAALIAAGAASSCAGLILGGLAMKPKQNAPVVRGGATASISSKPTPTLTPLHAHARRPAPLVYAPPPAFSSSSLPPPVLLPPPRAPLPGQCPLCHSWYQSGDIVAKLECGHVTHKVCTETVSRQPVYVGYRCTCAVCRGPAVVTKFAVAELVSPSPSPAPSSPIPPPPLPAVNEEREPRQAPMQSVRVPAAQVQPQIAPPLLTGGHTPFYLASSKTPLAGGGAYPSCTLCDCAECRAGGGGNCPSCGRCLCSRCVQGGCECGCGCDHTDDDDQLQSVLSSMY